MREDLDQAAAEVAFGGFGQEAVDELLTRPADNVAADAGEPTASTESSAGGCTTRATSSAPGTCAIAVHQPD